MKGLFIPGITSEMFRNGCLESIEELMAEGEIYDIEYSRWIPVSERLPEISGWYLVTGSRGAISVRYWRKAIPQQGGSYWRGSVNPIAWMPLPEPYKAGSEDKE